MKSIKLLLAASLIISNFYSKAQVHMQAGINYEMISEVVLNISHPTTWNDSIWESGLKGSSFNVPVSIGVSVVDMLDMGIGVQIGSTRIENETEKFEYKQTAPFYYMDGYLFPIGDNIRIGLGAQVRLGKASIDKSIIVSEYDEPSNTSFDNKYDITTTWIRFGYRLQANSRYITDDGMNAFNFNIGFQFNTGKLKEYTLNGADVPLGSNTLGSDFDLTATSFNVSYTRFFSSVF
jgi:hypothetical protein